LKTAKPEMGATVVMAVVVAGSVRHLEAAADAAQETWAAAAAALVQEMVAGSVEAAATERVWVRYRPRRCV
jgi:head-tail adaptor